MFSWQAGACNAWKLDNLTMIVYTFDYLVFLKKYLKQSMLDHVKLIIWFSDTAVSTKNRPLACNYHQTKTRWTVSYCSLMIPPLFGKQEVRIWRVKKRFPRYGVPIWSLWPNIRFLPSIVAEKNVHIRSMCIKTN